MALLAAGSALSAAAPTRAVFFAGVFVIGLGYGWVNPPTNILANPLNPRRRALSISVKQTGIPVGGMLAGALVAPVAAVHGWRVSLLVPFGMCCLIAIITAGWCPRPRSATDRAAGGTGAVRLRPSGRIHLRLPHERNPIDAHQFLRPVSRAAACVLSTTAAGVGLSLLLVGGVVGRPFWGWLSDLAQDDRVRVLQAAAFVACATLLILPVLPMAGVLAVLPAIGMSAVGWNGAFPGDSRGVGRPCSGRSGDRASTVGGESRRGDHATDLRRHHRPRRWLVVWAG